MLFGFKISVLIIGFILAFTNIFAEVYGQTEESQLFSRATEYFSEGRYDEAITMYDIILEKNPNNISTLKMKGVAYSNLGSHEESLKQFFKILQSKPDDITSLIGMGVGFGNLGEYQESTYYFEKALQKKPNNTIIKNYKEFVEKVTSKYPYTPTKKPQGSIEVNIIPQWFKTVAKWWSEDKIRDIDFTNTLQFLIESKKMYISVPREINFNETPQNIKENVGLWADGIIDDDNVAIEIISLIEDRNIKIRILQSEKDKQLQQDFILFEKYLKNISKNIMDEKRYIEYPNPSKEVIKKFLRDNMRWNFKEEIDKSSTKFPDPNYKIIDDSYLIYYKVFINDQPSDLPLDHKGTLESSFEYWENQELAINNKKAKVIFEVAKEKKDANIWITWTIRNLGEGVLGHAHLGKGVVEVTLGDYSCDGSFQLYDVASVEKIMTHELGHSIGLVHTSEPNSIMFSSLSPNYAYCLL